MSSSSDRALAREQQILDAALLVFARRGLAATRLDDLVLASGLSKGALYWYFESKEALILALLKRLLAVQLQHLQQLPGADGSVRDRLLLFAQQFSEALAHLPDLTSLLLEFYALAARKAEARQLFREFFTAYSGVFEDLFRQGIEQGEFRAIDITTAAHALIALAEGILLLYAFGALATPLSQAFENAAHLFLEGVCIPSETQERSS
jgi:AcrR family transcriptional regulator